MTAHGVQLQYWGKAEATFDTVSAFAATDAMGLIDLTLEPAREFEKLQEHVGTASLQGEIAGLQSGTWSAVSYIKPAAAGVAPDIGELFRAAMGNETIVGGTSVTYNLTDAAAVTLQLARYAGDNIYQVANGCWVEEMTIEGAGNTAPRVTFSGGFASMGHVYTGGVVSGAHSPAATAIQLGANQGNLIAPNALVKFDTEDNGGAGYTVTAVDLATDIITITPGLAGGLSGAELVLPVVPSQTLAGSVLGGVDSSLTVGGVAMGFTGSSFTLATGFHPGDQEGTSAKTTRVFRGAREVTCQLDAYYLSENALHFGAGANAGDTKAVALRYGPNTAASRATVNVPLVRFDTVSPSIPEAEEAVISLTGMGRQNAAAADEMTVVFD